VTKARTTALLVAVAFLVTLWWVIVERPKMLPAVYPGRLFAHLLRDDLSRIEIEKPEGVVVLARGAGGRWNLEKPISYPAGTGPVDTMLSALVFLEAKVIVEEGASDAFPAAGPRLVIRFTAEKETYIVEIGNRHVSEPLEYYRVGAKLFLGDENLKVYAGRTVTDWRDKSVCPVSPDYAGSITVEGGGKKTVIERSERGMWFMREPLKARADASGVVALIDGVNSLAVKEFLRDDGVGSLEPFGLAQPRWKATVASLAGRERHEILIGGRVGEGEPAEVYVKRTDRVQVFRCDDTVTALLGREPEDLRDLRALPFSEYGWVKNIAVRGRGRDFSLLRTQKDGNWMLISHEGSETKKSTSPRERGERLVDEVANLKIGKFLPGESIGGEQFRIEVAVAGMTEPQALILGREIDKSLYAARRKGVEGEDDVPFQVYTGLPDRIADMGEVVYEDARRAVIPEERFLAFEIFSRKGHWLLLKLAEWQADTYESVALDQEIVRAAAEVVRVPTAAFYEPAPAGLTALGLDQTGARLRARIPEGFGDMPYRWLIVGKQVDPPKPLSYARLDTNPAIFMIDPTPLEKLVEHLDRVCTLERKEREDGTGKGESDGG
jgi:hypothetical protein